MRNLKGKIALVTGGASGLGKAIAQRLSCDGARVMITDVQAELGRATASEYGIEFLEHDVSNEAQWSDVVAQIEGRHGRLNILVNNAGILGPKDASNPENTRLTDWKSIFAVNVQGVFLGCRAGIAAMRRAGGGSIVNIASIAGLLATPYAAAYGASKAAVRQLTRSVAQHCAQENLNIRCNAVQPGDVRTSLVERSMQHAAQARGVSIAEIVAERKASIPMGDFVLPEEIAAAVSFLTSEEARHVTGTELIVDGGMVNCDTFHMLAKRTAKP